MKDKGPTMSDTPEEYRPRCTFLTCKSLLVFGEDFEQDPEYDPASSWTCIRTSADRGPDDNRVALDLCSAPERTCFREF
jgi:hypothetical protein